LGRALLEQGQMTEATRCFERPLAIDPQCAEAAFNAGKAYAQQEQNQAAERAFAKASQLRPTKSIWRLQRLGLCPTIFQSVAELGMAKLRQGIRRHDLPWIPFGRRFTEAAKTIATASCDVLYFHKVSADPLGYLLPFARLAPIQCTSWATHFTSGVPEMDYYL